MLERRSAVRVIAVAVMACLVTMSACSAAEPEATAGATDGGEASAPDHVAGDAAALAVFNELAGILGDEGLSDEEKQDRVVIVQDKFGQMLVATVIRYVPVYDSTKGGMVDLDSYMRRLAEGWDAMSGSPLEADPVGAAIRIFFDPTAETIEQMTGTGLSPEERREALAAFQSEGFVRQMVRIQMEKALILAWEKVESEGPEVVAQAKALARDRAEDIVAGILSAREYASRELRQVISWSDDEMAAYLEKAAEGVDSATAWVQQKAGKVIDWAKVEVPDVAGDVKDWLDDTVDDVSDAAGGAADAVKDVWDSLTD